MSILSISPPSSLSSLRGSRLRKSGLAFALTLGVIGYSAGNTAYANTETTAWQAPSIETLSKLPVTNVSSSVDRNFRSSGLAGQIQSKAQDIQAKAGTMQDLAQALESAEGPIHTEIRHQQLMAKKDFVALNGERNELRRKAGEKKLKVYQALLRKYQAERNSQEPEMIELAQMQEAARARLEQTTVQVDDALFANSPAHSDSRYNSEYTGMLSQIEQLQKKINNHIGNKEPMVDGKIVDKEEYLAAMIHDAEVELALLKQEDQLIGLMSKLVALDSRVLSEEVAAQAALDDNGLEYMGNPVREGVQFFLD